MKAKNIILFLILHATVIVVAAQDKTLPYYEIPATPENFTAGNVAARMVDGLGFRFYWATEGLRPENLSFKPGAEARTTQQTIEHIYEMSTIILNSTKHVANVPQPEVKLDFVEIRKRTLLNLKEASDRLRAASDQDMRDFKIIFIQGDKSAEYPFWNQLNGPLADCMWHVGQIVSFRRSSGNPFTDKISLFSGRVMN